MSDIVIADTSNGISRMVGKDVGTEMMETVFDQMATDARLVMRRRELAAARSRLRRIQDDFRQIVSDLKDSFSEAEANLSKIFVEGSRHDLIRCFQAITPNIDDETQKRINLAVDKLIDDTLSAIKVTEKTQHQDDEVKSLTGSRRRRVTA